MTRGELTLDVEVDDVKGLARLLGERVSIEDRNVLLVDNVDAKATLVRTVRVDPVIPESPDATLVLLKREPALVEFLQCHLMRADPFLRGIMATHPCGG